MHFFVTTQLLLTTYFHDCLQLLTTKLRFYLLFTIILNVEWVMLNCDRMFLNNIILSSWYFKSFQNHIPLNDTF